MTTDLHADYIAAQAAGHHPDCDGFRTAHRVMAEPSGVGYIAVCDDCGRFAAGWHKDRAAVERTHRDHAQEVACDGRCRSWN
jgi:hypothetical protein